MWAAAVLHHGFMPRQSGFAGGRRPLTVESVSAVVEAAGLEVEEIRLMVQANSPESLRAWDSVRE
jgi:hypothetical protein